jgi:hypothetical protein
MELRAARGYAEAAIEKGDLEVRDTPEGVKSLSYHHEMLFVLVPIELNALLQSACLFGVPGAVLAPRRAWE